MNIKPYHSYVLIQRLPPEATYKGLILPEIRRYNNVVCKILAVGPGMVFPDNTREKMGDIKPGDYVLVHQQSGKELDTDIYFVDITEIDAKLENYEL